MNPVAREVTLVNQDGKRLLREIMTFCPACEIAHPFTVEVFDGYTGRGSGEPEPVWQWDGNLDHPTFSPSMLAQGSVHICKSEHPPKVCENPDSCGSSSHLLLDGDVRAHVTPHTRNPAWGNCHSFLRNGQWQFLGDCAHRLAGQTVDMVPLPDWLMPEST